MGGKKTCKEASDFVSSRTLCHCMPASQFPQVSKHMGIALSARVVTMESGKFCTSMNEVGISFHIALIRCFHPSD